MTWTLVIVIAIAVVLLAVAIWLLVRWRRKRAATAQPAGQPSLASQIAPAWRRFYRELPPRARHFPTVIVVGEAGAGKSHLIDNRVDWRGQANEFRPSAVDSPHLQLYLGSDVVVHELSAPLLHDLHGETRRELTRLWAHLGPSATVIVVVDARTLATTPPETLRELAQLTRGKIDALPSRGRAAVEVRVCLSHMDQLDGYDELVAVIGSQHGALALGALTDPLVDARGLAAAAGALMSTYDPNLSYGLATRSGEGFARLVGLYGTFPLLLTRLAPLLQSLTGDDPDQPHHRPSGLYLSSLVPTVHVGDPFVVDHALVGSSISRQRRFHRRTSLAVAAAGIAAAFGLMAWQRARVASAEAAVASHHALQTTPRGASDADVDKVAHEIARMHRGEALWLDHTFVARKRELERQFAADLRQRYLLPLLRVEKVNRSTMLYAVSLLYASEGNGLRALIRNNLDLWVTKLGLSTSAVSAYLDVSVDQYDVAEQFDPQYTGSDWESYVFDRVKPLYEQADPLTLAQLDSLDDDPPTLYDPREYAVRSKVVELLSAQVALATHPPIIKLLDSPLGLSSWVQEHEAALRGIRNTVAHHQLTPTQPQTLGELATDLERMLAVPRSGGDVYTVTLDERHLELDVATWRHKVAEASAAATIGWVRAHDDDDPEHPIGFFPAEETRRDVGLGSGSEGPTIGLPREYTAAEFSQHIAPALTFVTVKAPALGLPASQLEALEALYQDEIDDYADRYAAALRAYYDSFHFEPGSEEALPYALEGLTQPSSWFIDFLTTVSINAAPPLGDGPYFAAMADDLIDFRPLADLLATDKGTIPGLAPYQKIIAELATQLMPPEGGAAAADAGPPTLASTLSPAGKLVLDQLTGADKDHRAQVTGWLVGANIDASLQAPFLAPVRSAYAIGSGRLDRAVGDAWRDELSPSLAPILSRFPFSVGADQDVAIDDLQGALRAQGKAPGTFWTAFARWLGPVTVEREGRYRWLAGVDGPDDALATTDDLARLSRELWDADGNPRPLAIEIVPQPLDSQVLGGRVPTMAYLRSGASAIYAFNQRPGPSTLALRWWDQGTSSIIVRTSKPGAREGATDSIDEPESPFSFYRLLCRARLPTTTPERAATAPCEAGRGLRVWDVPQDGSSTRPVTLDLETDPWTLFSIAR